MTGGFSRRTFLKTTGAAAAATAIGAPAVHAQVPVLKTTAWGGKWGEVMKGQIIPAFEKECKCKVETDAAFPYCAKLQARPRNAPLYDVLDTNTSAQWPPLEEGRGEPNDEFQRATHLANVHP